MCDGAATVSAMSQVDILRIERGAMIGFIQKHPEVGERIEMVAHQRGENQSGSGIPDSPEQNKLRLKNIGYVIQKGQAE